MSRIEDYALIGDLHTAALVGLDGSIDWLCLPNFDSPACFAALLDEPRAGRWLMAPEGGGTARRRRYRGDTLVLETEWHTPEGHVRVIDFMPPRGAASDVMRIVEGVSGTVRMHSELTLRFDYGRVVPWVRRVPDGIEAIAGPDAVWLRTPVPLEGQEKSTVADFTVHAGERVPFVMTWSPSFKRAPGRLNAEDCLAETIAFWEGWSSRSRVHGRWRTVIQRSLITLKALTFAPTGGIVAAATTSLPEQLGGPRNWDYRYCWLRDSTYTLQALLAAGYVDEAKAWRDWLLRAVAGDPAELQIMYSIDGTRRLPEYELPWLSGYEGSAPVRVGNAAAGQLQLDVWGEVLDGLYLSRQGGLASDSNVWDMQVALLDYLEGAWREPDNGLWEMRGPRRHFTHSKVMAWVAFDRMVRSHREFGLPGDVNLWEARRDEIHAEVCERGFDAERNTFVQSYGSTELDASLLLIPRVGFLPGNDPRVAGTVDAISRDLTEDGFVLRYRTGSSDDGLPGSEGVFLACSFWLVDALHAIGREPDAVDLFERLLTLRNDVGLFSEEWDPKAHRQLGNTPQAFSHFPVIVSGLQLHARRHRRSDQPVPSPSP
ncbi:glycoside hydrolase family 15 protein [Rugosimonospora africana]|uniref:Trehalase n=1 Tax=Rugosimonospora africana TaxID=556532 RepID=A0A8J3VQ00_9ACTN|nr:glycoside hydrolase family 15 protein [Rugosimonospora africana]GIH14635.1 glucoamylase [Rugosimonospora africana]